jgi:AAA+ superfamily predicted ATPase
LIYTEDITGERIPNVILNIKNSSWFSDNITGNNGIFQTQTLQNGHYIITVSYLNHRFTKEIDIPNPGHDYNVSFALDKAQLLSERHGIESFPQWFVWAAFVLALIFIPFLYLGYQERRREMISKKRAEKIYKKMERPHGPRILDPLLIPLRPILKILEEEPKRIGISQFTAFFVLGLLGITWAPFYPWWLVIILGFAVASVSFRFPYLALIVLSLFVLAATAFQSPEFGIVFLIFSLIILICAFFSWKFGYLVLITVFLSRLGVLIFVPVTAALLYSLFMGLAVLVVSGLFLTFFVTCGNLTNLSFIIGPPHKSAFIIFNKPAPSEFLPVHFVDALGSLNTPNLELINNIFRSNYNSMIPIVEIVIWALAIYIIYYFTQKYSEKNFNQYLSFLIIPLVLFPLTSISALAVFEYELRPELITLSFALIGIGLAGALTSFAIKDYYPSIFKKEIERDMIGTRISQLMSLRRTSFRNVGGLDEIKHELRTSITIPLLRPKLSRLYGVNPPKGVMLFGPPGCGKTLIMRALATELNVEMISVKCSDIMSKWYGESEEMTARMFQIARSRKPCILFLDEIDAIAKRRSFYSTDDVTPRLLSIMLNELDGMDESAGIMVVGATNMPELIDPALLRPGRFDKIVYIPPPSFESRKEIFKIYLKNKPLTSGVNFYELAGGSDGFSGADIENVVKEASMHAMRRTLETHRRSFITMDDFNDVLKEIKPSISKKMQKEYEKLGFDYSRTATEKKKKKKKKFFERDDEEEDHEEDASEPIPLGDKEVSWEEGASKPSRASKPGVEEKEKEEPSIWDRYVPKRKPKKVSRKDEDIVFEPVPKEKEIDEDAESDEDEFEFVPEEDTSEKEMDEGQEEDEDIETEEESKDEKKMKGPYGTVWDNEEDSDDYWM